MSHQPLTQIEDCRTNDGRTKGPRLLALVVGLLYMLGAWDTWLQRPPAEGQLERLTVAGKAWYRPDYDVRIYGFGIGGTMALAILLEYAWRRRLRRARSKAQLESLIRLLWLHFPFAGCFALLPLVWPGSAELGWISAVLGSLACGGLLAASYADIPAWLDGRRPPKTIRIGAPILAAAASIVLLVYIPDPSQMTGAIYRFDKFHHWDFYVMGPALAFRHGGALGTEVYSQYGVGWPVLLALSSAITPLGYGAALRLTVLVGCAYYLGLFLFLRGFLKSWAWAFTGLFLVLLVELFSGTNFPKWFYPSSTILRCPLDIALLAICLRFARGGRAWWGLSAGMVAGLAILLSTDTGLYLSGALGVFTLGSSRLRSEAAGQRTGRFALGAGLGGAAVLLPGLALASRGTCLRPDFWRGWLEAPIMYGGGGGHLPIGGAMADWTAHVLLFCCLLVYLSFALRLAEQSWRRCASAEALVAGMIAVHGLAVLLFFIGRSHPYNLFHSSIPFCILLTLLLSRGSARLRRRWEAARSPRSSSVVGMTFSLVPWGCAYLALIAACAGGGSLNYPNLFHWAYRDRYATAPSDVYLFTRRQDVRLPRKFRPQVRRFAAITETLKKLSEGGRKQVAVIDYADTHFLVEADLRPYFRYSPVIANLLFKKQTGLVERQIADHPPDYILMPDRAPLTITQGSTADAYDQLRRRVRKQFTLQAAIDGMEIFKRNP